MGLSSEWGHNKVRKVLAADDADEINRRKRRHGRNLNRRKRENKELVLSTNYGSFRELENVSTNQRFCSLQAAFRCATKAAATPPYAWAVQTRGLLRPVPNVPGARGP